MPLPVSDLFSADRNDHLRDVLDSDPGWTKSAGILSAIGVSVVAFGTFVLSFRHVDRPWLLAILLTAAAAPFAVQCVRDFSHLVLAIATLIPLALLQLAGSPLGVYDRGGGRDQMSLMLLVWLVGETASIGRRREVIGVMVAGVVIVVGRVAVDSNYESAFIWSAGIGVALLAGLLIRTLVVALVNTKVAETVLREQATTEERQRIAREVHDVIAHSLTVTMLHLTAARMAVGRGDNAAATEALEEAERAGRTSLNEIRHTVGLLRMNGVEPETAPLPGATDVPALIANYQAAGVDVALELIGDLDVVEPAAGLALYRIVQESLTNAGRHSPGARSTVRIDVGPPLHVDVASEGGTTTSEAGSGLGLSGMTERAVALGGTLHAGRHGNGWKVAATIP